MYNRVLAVLCAVVCGMLHPAWVLAGSGTKKSINHYVTCDGRTDDAEGAAKAFAAAANSAFTLVVDCPVRLKIGDDIARPIFIDTGTTVEFTGNGKFIIDNIWQPAFVIANSEHITLTDWNVEYEGSLPVNPEQYSYADNGVVIRTHVVRNAVFPFNDVTLTEWLAAHRHIVFNKSQGTVKSMWAGPTNTAAVFFVIGSSADLNVKGMHLYVPANAGGSQFIPTAFSFNANYKSNQTVTAKTAYSSAHVAVPHDVQFSDIVLDGTYMGWVGNVRDALFENVQSHRYGDLQDAKGHYVGGVGKWFAPPHLFYFNYVVDGDAALYNDNIQIKDVVDSGPRVGVARDRGGSDSLSGYALSLKIGCVDCSVDSYTSKRVDGFLDLLPSNNLVISNASGTYDSEFTHQVYPGWRFPKGPYKHVTFENVSLKDTSATTRMAPVGGASQQENEDIKFTNVKVSLNHWQGSAVASLPSYYGTNHDIALDYTYVTDTARLMRQQKEPVIVTLYAKPATLKAGGSMQLTWAAREASSCSAGGAWSGGVSPQGARSIKMPKAGTYQYELTCRNSSHVSTTTVPVVVK